jgi:ferredoxin
MGQTQKLNQTSYVDVKECTGCESCVASVPKVFRMTVDGCAEVFNPQGDTQAAIQDAMDACPVSCIHWKK